MKVKCSSKNMLKNIKFTYFNINNVDDNIVIQQQQEHQTVSLMDKYNYQCYYSTSFMEAQQFYYHNYNNDTTSTTYDNHLLASYYPYHEYKDSYTTDNYVNIGLQQEDDNITIATASNIHQNSNKSISASNKDTSSVIQLTLQHLTSPPQLDKINSHSTAEANLPPFPFEQSVMLKSLENKDMYDNKKDKKTTCSEIEKRYICSICNHRSKRKHNLVEHILTHNPNRPKAFVCSYCNRPFARKYDMKRHEKIHTK
ncbi:MAG: hypothetical protein EXX96DRAFT_537993 [Benjaminiella poitrasii]|nr:MAG: hypothetical protein EXX96DRAFT_537993 [Benjaminiella poitrasii]